MSRYVVYCNFDPQEYFLGQPPSSDWDILERSLKHRMEHLVGKVGRFVHRTLQTKLGPMMDFGLIPITEGVGDDGPYFAIVETSLEVVEPDGDP